jgi:hypothetical protein
VGVFRLAGAPSDEYHLQPRGLDLARRYRVTLDNSGHTWEAAGHELAGHGLHVRVPGVLQSELLLFHAV